MTFVDEKFQFLNRRFHQEGCRSVDVIALQIFFDFHVEEVSSDTGGREQPHGNIVEHGLIVLEEQLGAFLHQCERVAVAVADIELQHSRQERTVHPHFLDENGPLHPVLRKSGRVGLETMRTQEIVHLDFQHESLDNKKNQSTSLGQALDFIFHSFRNAGIVDCDPF